MKTYNLSKIMKNAWEIFRKAGNKFAEALKMAWKSKSLLYRFLVF